MVSASARTTQRGDSRRVVKEQRRKKKPRARPRVLPVGTKAATPRPSGAVLARGTAANGRARRMVPFVLVAVGVAAYANSFGHQWNWFRTVQLDSQTATQTSAEMLRATTGWPDEDYAGRRLLAVHLLAGLALFGIVRRMLESERLRARYGSDAPWLALTVAAIWLVHPLQTSAVTYVIQRGESLMGLCYLLTLYCGIRGSQSPDPRRWFVAAIAACALGMASKEVMVTAPLMMLLCDRVFLSPSFGEIARRRWGFYLGLAATWVLLAVLVATSRPEEQTALVAALSPWRYAMTQFEIIVHYLRLAVWPSPLVFDYAWRLPRTLSSVLPWAAMVGALVGGTGLALWRQ